MASGNGISGLLNFKIFWGPCPQTPLETGVTGAPLACPSPAHKFLVRPWHVSFLRTTERSTCFDHDCSPGERLWAKWASKRQQHGDNNITVHFVNLRSPTHNAPKIPWTGIKLDTLSSLVFKSINEFGFENAVRVASVFCFGFCVGRRSPMRDRVPYQLTKLS